MRRRGGGNIFLTAVAFWQLLKSSRKWRMLTHLFALCLIAGSITTIICVTVIIWEPQVNVKNDYNSATCIWNNNTNQVTLDVGGTSQTGTPWGTCDLGENCDQITGGCNNPRYAFSAVTCSSLSSTQINHFLGGKSYGCYYTTDFPGPISYQSAPQCTWESPIKCVTMDRSDLDYGLSFGLYFGLAVPVFFIAIFLHLLALFAWYKATHHTVRGLFSWCPRLHHHKTVTPYPMVNIQASEEEKRKKKRKEEFAKVWKLYENMDRVGEKDEKGVRIRPSYFQLLPQEVVSTITDFVYPPNDRTTSTDAGQV